MLFFRKDSGNVSKWVVKGLFATVFWGRLAGVEAHVCIGIGVILPKLLVSWYFGLVF